MTPLPIPFNIKLLKLTDEEARRLKPVTVLDTFEGSTKNFHEDGLFSQSIFGRIGELERNRNMSYIDIKIDIFHPVIFDAINSLKSLYGKILAGKEYAVWLETEKDFVKSDPLTGRTGYDFFIEHWRDIVLPLTGSEKRLHNVAILKKYADIALNSKIMVLPAGLREYEILDNGQEAEDEFNKLYRKILAISSTIHKSLLTKENMERFNTSRYSLQLAFNELYDKLKSMLEGKRKLITGKWASRRIFNGTRNVITTTNITTKRLHDPNTIKANDTVIGLFQYLKGILPIAKHKLRSGFLSHVFTGSNSPAILVNKKTLQAEQVRIKPQTYDTWMSSEGLDDTIEAYGEEHLRSKPIEVEGYWLGLIYKPKSNPVFRLFQDIEDLPDHLDRADVYPITFTELMYLSVYEDAHTYPCFITRYPVTGFGSIYPSYVYLKPTMVVESRRPLNSEWILEKDAPEAFNFPVGDIYVNTTSPSASALKGLGADFDGDMISANIVYSDEAKEEVKKLLNSKKYYLNTEGKIAFSMGYDTVNYILKTMTGEPRAASMEEFEAPIVHSVNGILVQTGKADPIEPGTEKVDFDASPVPDDTFQVMPSKKLFEFDLTASYDETSKRGKE